MDFGTIEFEIFAVIGKNWIFYSGFRHFLADNGKNRYLCCGFERKTCR